jgi:phosphoglycerate dehydrogenase-like enzyme
MSAPVAPTRGRKMIAAFAMEPRLLGEVFPLDLRRRLARVATLPGGVLSSFGGGVLADVEVLITGWGCPPIDAAALAAAPRLRAVVHAAGSVKGHVGPEVFDRGVSVSSAAAANAVPVAEYTVAMLVLAAKWAPARARDYAGGGWSGDPVPGVPVPGERSGLYGATVGVVAASKIGRLVIERLRAMGARVLLSDPHVTPTAADRLGVTLAGLDELCRGSDLVTVHAPELPDTRGLFDDRRLGLLRDGATLINTARGALVDTAALTRHCATGRIHAVLDVTDPEPLPPGHPLLRLPNVLVTPHISGARGRELRRLGEFAAAEVERFVQGEPLRGAVRLADLHRIA